MRFLVGERLRRINRELRSYDRNLFAVQANTGVIHVLRKAEKWEAADALDIEEADKSTRPQFIFATTDDWTQSGSPREWGIEPIMEHLRAMDSWTASERPLAKIRRNRERLEQETKRAWENTNRAIAADMRRDFARVTNDIRMGGN
jgi:hypothetical protein